MIIAAVAIAAGASAVTVYLVSALRSGDEDRPPIIVRSGSVKIDGGEPNSTNWKKWAKQNGDAKKWQPDHGNGGSARNFSVAIANSNGAAAPSAPCPSLPLVGTKVYVEYTTEGGAKSTVTISLVTSGNKRLPQVDAPADMTQVDGSGTTPDQIVYDPGAGLITNVTVSDDSGAQQLCGFVKPASAVITIKPNR
jgi:hypothetical protein